MDERCIPADELLRDVDRWIDEIRSDIEAYDENVALRTPNDGLTTDQRAIAALQRPERFRGEHQVARVWFRNSPTAYTFTSTNDDNEVKDGEVSH